jgi:hypothetical protein
MAAAVVSIADSQSRRVIEPRRRNNISLMQSEDVPISVRKEFFSKMAAEVMASFDAGTFLENGASLNAEDEVFIHRMSRE